MRLFPLSTKPLKSQGFGCCAWFSWQANAPEVFQPVQIGLLTIAANFHHSSLTFRCSSQKHSQNKTWAKRVDKRWGRGTCKSGKDWNNNALTSTPLTRTCLAATQTMQACFTHPAGRNKNWNKCARKPRKAQVLYFIFVDPVSVSSQQSFMSRYVSASLETSPLYGNSGVLRMNGFCDFSKIIIWTGNHPWHLCCWWQWQSLAGKRNYAMWNE